MSIARCVAEVLGEHVVLEVEAIDRMYLNVYVPHLQSVGAVVGYLRVHRGQRFASTTAVTPMTEARRGDPGHYEYMVSRIPLGRYGEPDEVAYGVLYLASDEAAFVTGSELVIDGGWTAQ